MNYFVTDNTAPAVALADIPESPYAAFYDDLAERLADRKSVV